ELYRYMTHKKEYALITGAGKGLGKAFAEELAKRNKNVLLAALPGENLATTACEISKNYKVKTDYIECDLTKEEEIYRVVNWVKKQRYPVNTLINNAGIGGTIKFEEAPDSFVNNMILLNIRATSLLT